MQTIVNLRGIVFLVLKYFSLFPQIGPHIDMALIKQRNEAGELQKKLVNPSYRDTVAVHSQSYAVFRFYTDNPGTRPSKGCIGTLFVTQAVYS